jgi:hypothetical protein
MSPIHSSVRDDQGRAHLEPNRHHQEYRAHPTFEDSRKRHDAPFAIFSGTGSFNLARGKTHAIKLSFAPTRAIKFHGSITIDSSDQGLSPFSVSISGSGR